MSDPQPTDQPARKEPEKDNYSIPAEAEIVFNAVTGPNFRLRDNLIQLAVIVIGTILGGFIGYWLGRSSRDQGLWTIGGVFVGLVGSLAISGLIIGFVRTVLSVRRVVDKHKKP